MPLSRRDFSLPVASADLQSTAVPTSAPRWDVRLVPAAALGWLIASAAPLLPVAVLGVVAASALLLGVGSLSLRWYGRSGAHPRWVTALALALAGSALVAGSAAAHIYARDESPLRDSAAQGQDVRLRLRVTEPIRFLSPGGGSSRLLVAGSVLAVTCDRPCGSSSVEAWSLRADILIFAPTEGWAQLVPGSTVTATVHLAPAAPADLLVAIAFARGPPRDPLPPAGVLDMAAAGVRHGMQVRADRVLHPDEAGLLRGIVLGDTAGMDAVVLEQFRISGLAHITAVSGAIAS